MLGSKSIAGGGFHATVELTVEFMYQIMTEKLPFEEVDGQAQIIYRVILGELPAIRDNAQLSPVLNLCSLMSDCWVAKPVKRVDAATFHKKVYQLVCAWIDHI